MKKNEPVYIGYVLEKLRREKRLSQDELSAFSSLDRNTIGQLERKESEPRLSTLYAIATALEMEFIDFMKEVHENFKRNG